MCIAFSGIVDFDAKVTWKLGVESHTDLAKLGGYADQQLGEFSKFEITPKNKNYLFPDEWIFQWNEDVLPSWCGTKHKEAALAAHKKWIKQLNKILVRKKVVHPFRDIAPPAKIERKHILLLKKWDSVGSSIWVSVSDSVRGSIEDSIWVSVRILVRGAMRGSIWDSVWNSIEDSIRVSVWDSVYAYSGSFFKIPKWKNVEHIKGAYPFRPAVTLWNQGIVPSFDGITWRLHGGPKADVLFSITRTELKKYK
jgi:hypothetical protein